MGKLIKCKSCGTGMSKKAKACPQCGEPARKSIGLGGLLVVVIFGSIVYSSINPSDPPEKKVASVPTKPADIDKKTNQLLKELKTIPVSELKENFDRYEMLVKMHPKEQKYKNKLSFYKSKIDRKNLIKSQFSSWDGSHRQFSRYIEKNLKNPDSFEHVETLYSDKGDYLLLETTYRATNSFNAVTTGKAYAKASIDGSSLEIIAID